MEACFVKPPVSSCKRKRAARSAATNRPACSSARSCSARLNWRSVLMKNSDAPFATCVQTIFPDLTPSTRTETITSTLLSNVSVSVKLRVDTSTERICPVSTRSAASESDTICAPLPAENSSRK